MFKTQDFARRCEAHHKCRLAIELVSNSLLEATLNNPSRHSDEHSTMHLVVSSCGQTTQISMLPWSGRCSSHVYAVAR